MEQQAFFNDTKTISEKAVSNILLMKLVDAGAATRNETLSLTDGEIVDPDALEAAKAAAKASASKEKIDRSKLPKIAGKVVLRGVHYTSAEFDDLNSCIQESLKAAVAKKQNVA
jgi:hypothetical protein